MTSGHTDRASLAQDLLGTALDLHDAGMSVIPVRTDGTKRPALPSWKANQQSPATVEDLARWFAGTPAPHQAIGVVTGPVSGNLELLEIEGGHVHLMDEVDRVLAASNRAELWDRINTGWVEASPSGGWHWLIRVEGQDVPGNTKLASTEDNTVIAETRGRGGYVIVAPTAGHAHPTGNPWVRTAGGPATVPTITAEEREDLHAAFRMLNRAPRRDTAPAPARSSTGVDAGDRPGDQFEARTDWAAILEPHGWQVHHVAGRTTYWTRPGKSTALGYSASTGHAEDRDRLWVFTTSTDFDPEESITKFHAYAVLNTGGDHRRAAAELADKGYGHQPTTPPPPPAPVGPRTWTFEDVHRVFRRWLGAEYDTGALDAVLATAAVERLDGDPVWLLVISGSGNAKTETVMALAGAGAHTVSTIASEGALLSATSRKEKAEDATGGLLRKIGSRGVVVIKDVTSILSMSGDQRDAVLGALREVYDGQWSRNVGTDGGRTLEWEGRLAVIGAVTTAWDKAHSVIAKMGDRFVLVRMDSTRARQPAGRRAIGNTGHEAAMRSELADAVARLLAGMDPAGGKISEAETDVLLAAADLVTRARTAVERDYRGDVIDAHAPEMPTRFAKQLAQIVRGAVALGMDRTEALALAIRCARDSMPPLRLRIIDDVAAHPTASTAEVRKRLNLPRATVDRELQALQMLGVLTVDEALGVNAGREVTVWRYTLAEGIDPEALHHREGGARNCST